MTNPKYKFKKLKGLPDKQNPLNPVNHTHYLLKRFLNAHSGFNKDELFKYMDLFSFVSISLHDPLEKVYEIEQMAFQKPKPLRYRAVFGLNP